jgi:hypothetical protein
VPAPEEFVQMSTDVRCNKHLFEEASAMCRSCRGAFCEDCLVYTHGPKKAPLCVPCALTAAGVRSTASARSQRGSGSIGTAGKLMVGLGSTAVAAAIAIPALSQLH